jgi:phosphatidylserine/phosphatidylglycerophosphate/cardiolipin synthase-like enzyme
MSQLSNGKCYLLVLSVVCFVCSCNTSSGYLTNSGDGSGGGDSTSELTVKPINITFPEADFTDPSQIAQGNRSKAITGRLEDLINAAPKGASIYMSIYGFDIKAEDGLRSAVRKAVIRGVKIHIMLDDQKPNDPTVEVLSAISKAIDLVVIHNDMSGGINHNKFALFSDLITKTGNAKHVVFTTSQNWGPHSETEIQNAVILMNKGLYEAYKEYWKDMKSRADNDMANFQFRTFNDSEEGISAIFYPKRKNGHYFGPDPIANILDNITDPASTTIQIEMPFWTQGRPAIISKLKTLLHSGARVEIVVRSSVPVYDALVDLSDQGAYVKMYNYTHEPNVKRIKLHSKVMMIRGEWKGEKTKLVITGSENYAVAGLKTSNDNNIILNSRYFNHPRFFNRFEDNFNKIKDLPGVCCTKKD